MLKLMQLRKAGYVLAVLTVQGLATLTWFGSAHAGEALETYSAVDESTQTLEKNPTRMNVEAVSVPAWNFASDQDEIKQTLEKKKTFQTSKR